VPKPRRISFSLLLLIVPLVVRPPSVRTEMVKECTISSDGAEVCSSPEDTLLDDLKNDDFGNDLDDDFDEDDDDDFLKYSEDEAEPVITSGSGKKQDNNRCRDENPECEILANRGECDKNDDTQIMCPRSCMLCPDQQTVGKKQDNNRWRDVALSKGMLIDFEDRGSSDDDEGAEDECIDSHEQCSFWAEHGECDANPSYMHYNCRVSCKTCPKRALDDNVIERSREVYDAAVEYRDGYWFYTKGEPQKADGELKNKTKKNMLETMAYMRDIVLPDREYDSVRNDCINRHELCAFWVVLGECKANPSYMTLQCAPSCQTCHLIDMKKRCPIDPNAKPAFAPNGELNAMFQRIVDGYFDQYAPVIHHRPEEGEKDGLWIVTFDNFLTDKECDRLIELGYELEYKRSLDVGGKKFDGTFDTHLSSGRTSENAWCQNKCEKDEVTIAVTKRMENVTTVPVGNYESLQILKYTEGQHYNQHHDFIGHQVGRQCGPRVLTFFLYLSDVEAGGATSFPKLGIDVMPKKGKALLWPSVLDSNLEKIDSRTHHAALKVEKGTKFAANAWMHLYDYMGPNEIGCT